MNDHIPDDASLRKRLPRESVTDITAIAGAPLNIVLVAPQIPPNTGNVARLCAATGAALHLVRPLGFSLDDRDLKRAGLDYWDALNVIIHDSLEEFLATDIASDAWLLSAHAQALYSEVTYRYGDTLIFGSETTGLPKSLLAERREKTLTIPMRREHVRSLNLSTSVGIVAYAALAQFGFAGGERGT